VRNTTVAVQESQTIDATADQTWSLLGSPAAWSLQSGGFTFDVPATASTGLLRVLVGLRGDGVACEVLEVTEEKPGRSVCLRSVSTRPGQEQAFTLSVLPGGRRVQAGIGVREVARRAAKREVEAFWRKRLTAWLTKCQAVLEGRTPWPDGLPADLLAACTEPGPLTEPVGFSAATPIAAPPTRVWQTLWDPETTLRMDTEGVAAGRVPGTPAQQAGEMQYFIRRRPDGRLTASLGTVLQADAGRSALVRSAGPVQSEVLHLIEPEGEGTRLTLTASYPRQLVHGHFEQVGSEVTKLVTGYKTLLEESGPAGNPGS
jgi:hypothetical protein